MAFVVFVTALAVQAALAQVFPSPGGPFGVAWKSQELVDEDRVDPFNASHSRRIMISHFTPVAREHCTKRCRVPYLPEQIAAIEDEIFADALSEFGWAPGLFSGLEVDVCCEVSAKGSTHPTLLFGPGLNTTRLFYTATAMEIASLGYQVIAIDHPYETDVVLFPDGEIIFGGRVAYDPDNLTSIEFGLEVRNSDVSFVLDTFRIPNTVYFGHSYGGASAAAAVLVESRVCGGLNLDGTLWGPVITAGVSKPFINFAGETNSSNDESWKAFYKAQDEKHPDVWARELHLEDSLHNSLWDLSLIGDITDLRKHEVLVEAWLGAVTGKRVMEVLRAYLGDFAEFILLGANEGLLAGENEAFPDVEFVR